MDKVFLAQSQDEFNKQAEEFLATSGFPTTAEFKHLYATMVQHLPETNDYYVKEDMARAIRRVRANEFAFHLIRALQQESRNEIANGQEAQSPAEAVVQEASTSGV
jgi:hypothetical protein